MKSRNMLTYVLFGLLVIGILSAFISNPAQLLIPIIILGGVFLLYKFPLSPFKREFRHETKRRRTKLKVIQGYKTDRSRSSESQAEPEEPPRYH